MSKRIRELKGFIFDLDGTLMHSALDFSNLRQAVGCPQNTDILHFVDSLDCQARQQAHGIIKQHELEDARNATWIDGAKRLISTLQSLQRPVAIVTRNCQEAARLKLSADIELVTHLLTREDAPAKPDPTALLKISEQWDIAPGDLAYVGDYLYDVQAANNAGMLACLYVPGTRPDYAELADWHFNHFDEFNAVLTK